MKLLAKNYTNSQKHIFLRSDGPFNRWEDPDEDPMLQATERLRSVLASNKRLKPFTEQTVRYLHSDTSDFALKQLIAGFLLIEETTNENITTLFGTALQQASQPENIGPPTIETVQKKFIGKVVEQIHQINL